MADTFATLKKSRSTQMEQLAKQVDKLTKKNEGSKDERFWRPDTDKAGNGYAVIRFLPAPGGEDVPFVRLWSHAFQGPGGWYIENSLTSIGKDDPLGLANQKLWNSGNEDDKKIARTQKRKLNYISNILVIEDPAHPENAGKVMLYKYGKKIFDKLNELMNPSFQDEIPVNPFDLWEGANFKLKIRQVEGYRNYDKSEFEKPAPVSDDEKEMERFWKAEHGLQQFIAPDQFKSFEDLEKRLNRVLSGGRAAENTTQEPAEEVVPFKRAEAPKAGKIALAPAASKAVDDGEADDGLEFFRGLANE